MKTIDFGKSTDFDEVSDIKLTDDNTGKVVKVHHGSTPNSLFARVKLKAFLHYKTTTSQNVLSEAQIKNFFIL